MLVWLQHGKEREGENLRLERKYKESKESERTVKNRDTLLRIVFSFPSFLHNVKQGNCVLAIPICSTIVYCTH